MSDSVLKWQEGAISQAFVSQSASGEHYAVLKCNPEKNTEIASLQNNLFGKHHLLSYPKTVDGEHCLVVHGFNKTEELTSALTSLGVTSGQPNIDKMKEEPHSIGQKWDSFRHNGALKVSGAMGAMGHVLLATQGVIEESKRNENGKIEELNLQFGGKIQLAAMFMVNCALYAKYGNGDRGVQSDKIITEMHDFLAANDLDPKKTQLSELVNEYQTNKSFTKKLDDFVADNLIQVNESLGALCNVAMVKNGLLNNDMGMTIAGISSFIGSMTAIFVEEKPMSEQKPEDMSNPLKRAWAFVQESPMRINGWSNIINSGSLFLDPIKRYDALHNDVINSNSPIDVGKSALKFSKEGFMEQYNEKRIKIDDVMIDRSNNLTQTRIAYGDGITNGVDAKTLAGLEKAYKAADGLNSEAQQADLFRNKEIAGGERAWIMPTVMSSLYMGATLLSTISSKDAGKSDDPYEQYAELFARTAQVAIQIPEGQERDKVITLMSAKLASHPEVKGLHADEINTYLHKEIVELQQNPFNSVGKSERIVAAKNIVPISRKPESQISPNAEIDISKLQKNPPELVQSH